MESIKSEEISTVSCLETLVLLNPSSSSTLNKFSTDASILLVRELVPLVSQPESTKTQSVENGPLKVVPLC